MHWDIPNIKSNDIIFNNMHNFYKHLIFFFNNVDFSHVLEHDVHFYICQSSFWLSHWTIWRDASQCDVACGKTEELYFSKIKNTSSSFK